MEFQEFFSFFCNSRVIYGRELQKYYVVMTLLLENSSLKVLSWWFYQERGSWAVETAAWLVSSGASETEELFGMVDAYGKQNVFFTGRSQCNLVYKVIHKRGTFWSFARIFIAIHRNSGRKKNICKHTVSRFLAWKRKLPFQRQELDAGTRGVWHPWSFIPVCSHGLSFCLHNLGP